MRAIRGTVLAPAKLNLHLAVLGLRPDGFHGIESVFQAISMSDRIEFELSNGDGIDIQGDFDCPPGRNTMHAAASLFFQAAGLKAALRLSVDKRIPAGAGMGGGSSDAGAVLRALDLAYGHPLPPAELAAIGAKVGSDVPFFLGSAAAYVGGRGELIEPLPARDDFSLVVVAPDFPIATKDAYARVDASRADAAREASARAAAAFAAPVTRGFDRLAETYRHPPETWDFRNDFFDALLPAYPRLGDALDAIKATGALFAGLTGSGSALFGVYNGRIEAERAGARLEDAGWRAFPCRPLAKIDEIR